MKRNFEITFTAPGPMYTINAARTAIQYTDSHSRWSPASGSNAAVTVSSSGPGVGDLYNQPRCSYLSGAR